MRQHKQSLTWKRPYVVEQVYANHALRLRSLIQDISFITHVTRARIYRNIDHDLRQEMLGMKLTAEHNNCIPYVVAKSGHLHVEKQKGDMFIWTQWVGFESVEGTMEPLYEKWVDVPRMLTEHLQARADDDDELAYKALKTLREFEEDQGDHRPATMGNTTVAQQVYQKLLYLPHRPNHPY
jgi:hypothetical protein